MRNNDFTDLLGPELIAAGFRLYIVDKCQHLLLNAKEVVTTYPDDYSLKAIREFCRRYLQDTTTPPLKTGARTHYHAQRIR